MSRALYNSYGSDVLGDSGGERNWRDYSWSRSVEISPCELGLDDDAKEDLGRPSTKAEREEGEVTPREETGTPLTLSLLETFSRAIEGLRADLRAAQARVRVNLYRPAADEVKLGLASRQYRLLSYIATTPRLWIGATAAHFVRSMVDLRITSAWLLQQKDPALYERYQEYGRGKLKLFKLQLEEQHPEGFDDETANLHLAVEAELDQDIMEEFQRSDLGGNLAGKSLHKMAEEAGLKSAYSLSYQPLSGEAHGEWPSLDRNDMARCRNPLHLYHRLGNFRHARPHGSR